MSRWYRAYEGTVTDAKLGEIALVAGCSRSVAIAAWHCILESAASSNNGGSFDVTARRVAVILCEPVALIEAVFNEMAEMNMISSGVVSSWKARQYESDSSTERSRKFRERNRNSDATLQQRHATPPDTDTDTDTEKKKEQGPRKRVVAVDLPEWVPAAEWAGWLDMRKAKRSAASPRAQQLALAKLKELKQGGHDPGAVLDQSTLKGWTDLYPIKAAEASRVQSDGWVSF